jgi:hypothetical protein
MNAIKKKKRVVLYIEDDEEVKVFKKNTHYKLSDQVDAVYNAETLMNADLTYWCQVGQEWV